MKPLLILAKSETRWPAVESLLEHEERIWLDDLRRRLVDGIPKTRDAFAMVPDGAQARGCGCIRRSHEIGVLGHLYIRPEHRTRGMARSLMQALLSWFDVTGGKWLYLTCPAELAGGLFEHFGFRLLGDAASDRTRVTMLRTLGHAPESPFTKLGGPQQVRDVARADWPQLVALLKHHAGADPRQSLADSALQAETTALELITQQEQEACRLVAAARRDRIIGLGSLAANQSGHRTYAMLLPHDNPPEGLRAALLEAARVQNYEQVDFPMEALAEGAREAEPEAQARETAGEGSRDQGSEGSREAAEPEAQARGQSEP